MHACLHPTDAEAETGDFTPLVCMCCVTLNHWRGFAGGDVRNLTDGSYLHVLHYCLKRHRWAKQRCFRWVLINTLFTIFCMDVNQMKLRKYGEIQLRNEGQILLQMWLNMLWDGVLNWEKCVFALLDIAILGFLFYIYLYIWLLNITFYLQVIQTN